MSEKEIAVVAPKRKTATKSKTDRRPRQVPRFHVMLWNDDDHTYEYVILMLRKLFGHTIECGVQLAKQVDGDGKAIVLTTTKEHAELKRDQIHAFGPDASVRECQGSMSATIEPVA